MKFQISNMRRAFRASFIHISVLVLMLILFASVAQADPITGRIGVGTWGTQAEFDNVRVVSGTKKTYQSLFGTRSKMDDWQTQGGTWSTRNGYMRQTSTATPAMAYVGDRDWTNYTMTLRARKISGDEGFLISFGSQSDATFGGWVLGGNGNTTHNLQKDGFAASDVAGKIETNVWYNIRVEVAGIGVRCYLDNVLVHDTSRLCDSADRKVQFDTLINSPGYRLLNLKEKAALNDLAGRDVYIGRAARATFDDIGSEATFRALTAQKQAFLLRQVNKRRMTWHRGIGFGIDESRDATITNNMDEMVVRYNDVSVFDLQITANNQPEVPTADGHYKDQTHGNLRFGKSLSLYVFAHEINHILGVGQHPKWRSLMEAPKSKTIEDWTGKYGNIQLSELDVPGSIVRLDAGHLISYGLVYSEPYSDETMRRSMLLQAALRRDLGIVDNHSAIANQLDFGYADSSTLSSGRYVLIPRDAPALALTARGSKVSLGKYTAGADQTFALDFQEDGTYRIRTALKGNRALGLPDANDGTTVANNTALRLLDGEDGFGQRWFLIPTDSGFFKISPRNDNFKAVRAAGKSTIDITDNYDGFDQQWKLVLASDGAAKAALIKATPLGGIY